MCKFWGLLKKSKYSIQLKGKDWVAWSCILAPSGRMCEFTKPSLHLLAEYCSRLTEFREFRVQSAPQYRAELPTKPMTLDFYHPKAFQDPTTYPKEKGMITLHTLNLKSQWFRLPLSSDWDELVIIVISSSVSVRPSSPDSPRSARDRRHTPAYPHARNLWFCQSDQPPSTTKLRGEMSAQK